MTTRKEIIIKKYLEFQEKIKLFDINDNIFPSLEEMDVVDILIYFSTTFGCTTDIKEYETYIRDLIIYQKIKIEPEKLDKVMPLMIQFIDEFKLLQKSF